MLRVRDKTQENKYFLNSKVNIVKTDVFGYILVLDNNDKYVSLMNSADKLQGAPPTGGFDSSANAAMKSRGDGGYRQSEQAPPPRSGLSYRDERYGR